MQVRIHGDDAIEAGRQQVTHDVAAEGLAPREDHVLPQVAHVRGRQDQPAHASPPPGVACLQQWHQLGIRPVEGAVDDHRPRRFRHGGQGLLVGEAVHRHEP